MTKKILIIGAGFTGLSMAYELLKNGFQVTILEAEEYVGGLAGSFSVEGNKIEKFYHHWFTSDIHVMDLIKDIGKNEYIKINESKTGIYYSNKFFKLSNPLDLILFKPISVISRIRLGLLALRVRLIKDWKPLEKISAVDWLKKMAGDEVFRVVWEPLLRGKFGNEFEKVSAVWMWNKLKLRGSSRNNSGKELLAYYKGGFEALLEQLVDEILKKGGVIFNKSKVEELIIRNKDILGIKVNGKIYNAEIVIFTTPLPVAAEILKNVVSDNYYNKLKRITYLANICIVLELNKSLSETYWMNINDPKFPFVAIIEHTNFENKSNYGGRHIVYLSKYLPEEDILYKMHDNEVVEFSLRNIKKMFPKFNDDWLIKASVWRGKYTQPIVEKNYSELIPCHETEIKNVYLNTMAQIYPEDRGTNYAIREGRNLAKKIIELEKYRHEIDGLRA